MLTLHKLIEKNAENIQLKTRLDINVKPLGTRLASREKARSSTEMAPDEAI